MEACSNNLWPKLAGVTVTPPPATYLGWRTASYYIPELIHSRDGVVFGSFEGTD